MNVVFVNADTKSFYPFTLTKPLSEIKLVSESVIDKWKKYWPEANYSNLTETHLSEKFPFEKAVDNLFVDARIVPTEQLVKKAKSLLNDEALTFNKQCVVMRSALNNELDYTQVTTLEDISTSVKYNAFEDELLVLQSANDFFLKLGDLIDQDEKFDKKYKVKGDTHDGVTVIGDNLRVEKGGKIYPSIINTETGPVVIDEGATVMEGCIIRGPFYLGKGATLKMGAKVYGPTSIGAHCKVGGEVSNCHFQAFSNKGHDGFLGNSAIGEWCNLGADTNSSNLKNNYSFVKQWDYNSHSLQTTKMQFCGLLMGDHSKTAINTQLNTATSLGAFVNIATAGFPPKYLPSFTWYVNGQEQPFEIKKALEMADSMMARRSVKLSSSDVSIIEYLSEQRL